MKKIKATNPIIEVNHFPNPSNAQLVSTKQESDHFGQKVRL
ncbi:hypothetical protein ADIARSV_0961 [Arcticibacter svalbardensis MN12-7]|uniref:Uncharacterized protein n=1 Tax=Arcticibacter svalbardensis MN12-7 TaxID=1150600 RepID=R9H3Q8_9SPHI|nr:hypothetical protein ADIARSV_0961 [Arcticibacter svalbardensis MN12-7]